jgi:UDP-N-acetyl-D-mannosaminuronate dehydrogenase
MAVHAVDAVEDALGGLRGRTVAVLGLAFRAGVKEDFHSGAYRLVEVLVERGASARVHDPLYTTAELEARGLEPYELGASADGWILHTAHAEYSTAGLRSPDDLRVIYDGRRAYAQESPAGACLITLGAGS